MRRLRIWTACLCLVISLGFIGLWVQSCLTYGNINGIFLGNVWLVGCSWNSRVSLLFNIPEPVAQDIRWEWSSIPSRKVDREVMLYFQREQGVLGFFGLIGQGSLSVMLPHWFLVLLTSTVGMLLKPKPRLRFDMRDLLVLTTVLAVVLAAITCVPRNTAWEDFHSETDSNTAG